MTLQTVAGIDVSKRSLYVTIRSFDQVVLKPQSFKYDDDGLTKLFAILKAHGITDVAFESTGGYERLLFKRVHEQGLTPYQLEARSVQELARSFKKPEKTDKIDCNKIAMALLIHKPKPSYCPTDAEVNLRQLVDWRNQLVEERTRFSNQKEKRAHQSNEGLADWFDARQKVRQSYLNAEIKEAELSIQALVAQDETLAAKAELLTSMPGIGKLSAWGLMAKIPELGTLTPKQTAKLAGLAPRCNQSGDVDGVRRTQKSRLGVKSVLWMAALSAARVEGPLKQFYNKLVGKEKHASVARVAVMRRMLCALNAMLREQEKYDASKMKERSKNKKDGAVTAGAALV